LDTAPAGLAKQFLNVLSGLRFKALETFVIVCMLELGMR
jgi:hypothetical protein